MRHQRSFMEKGQLFLQSDQPPSPLWWWSFDRLITPSLSTPDRSSIHLLVRWSCDSDPPLRLRHPGGIFRQRQYPVHPSSLPAPSSVYFELGFDPEYSADGAQNPQQHATRWRVIEDELLKMHIISFFLLPNVSTLYEPHTNCSIFFFLTWQRTCEQTRGEGEERYFSTNVPETRALVSSEGHYNPANLCTLCLKVKSRWERVKQHVCKNVMILMDVHLFLLLLL